MTLAIQERESDYHKYHDKNYQNYHYIHYSSISIILKRSSAHLCARVHVPPCLALGQGPHPAQLLGADAARGFWRWWLQSRRSRCKRWWLR